MKLQFRPNLMKSKDTCYIGGLAVVCSNSACLGSFRLILGKM